VDLDLQLSERQWLTIERVEKGFENVIFRSFNINLEDINEGMACETMSRAS
jgi:hypothetical protein